MAQGEGGAAPGGEIGDVGQKEHRGVTAESDTDILRMRLQHLASVAC